MSPAQGKADKPGADAAVLKAEMAGDRASEAREDFEAQIATLREELAKVKAQLASSTERSASAARRAAASGAEHLRAQGEAAVNELRASAGDIEAQIADVVREKPMTSLAIAAGFGFLLALISRR